MSNREIIELANIIAERPCDTEDCAPCIRMGRRCNDYLKAERAIKAGFRKCSEWISVEDRLPEKEGKYLICTDRGYVTFGFFGNYDGNGNLTILRNNPRFDYRNVIYWMPLPEPPKGE